MPRRPEQADQAPSGFSTDRPHDPPPALNRGCSARLAGLPTHALTSAAIPAACYEAALRACAAWSRWRGGGYITAELALLYSRTTVTRSLRPLLGHPPRIATGSLSPAMRPGATGVAMRTLVSTKKVRFAARSRHQRAIKVGRHLRAVSSFCRLAPIPMRDDRLQSVSRIARSPGAAIIFSIEQRKRQARNDRHNPEVNKRLPEGPLNRRCC